MNRHQLCFKILCKKKNKLLYEYKIPFSFIKVSSTMQCFIKKKINKQKQEKKNCPRHFSSNFRAKRITLFTPGGKNISVSTHIRTLSGPPIFKISIMQKTIFFLPPTKNLCSLATTLYLPLDRKNNSEEDSSFLFRFRKLTIFTLDVTSRCACAGRIHLHGES